MRQHDRRQDAAGGVDREPPAPAGVAHPEPVPDHARLAQGEAQEHADRVQRDEGVRVAAEGPQQPERDRRQQDDAPRVREAVAAERELAGHVAVLGEDRGEAREGVEARVRGEEQDERRRHGEQVGEGRARRRRPRRPPAPRPTDRPPPSGAAP